MSISFVPTAPAEKESLVAMFREYRFALQETSWWDWKYLENPHGVAKSFKIMCDGRLAGAVAIMPQLFNYQDRVIHGLQTVDGLMGKEIRGKRLFNEVMAFLLENRPAGVERDYFYLSFPSLQASIRAHENAGWTRLANGLVYTFPLRVEGVIRNHRWRAARPVLKPLFALYRKLLLRVNIRNLRLEAIDRFTPEMIPELDNDRVRGDRSPEMLNWRVFANPRDDMSAFIVYESDRCVGYFVCKTRNRCLEVVDARFAAPKPEYLILLLERIAEECLADSVDFLVFGNHPNIRLRPSWGFIKRVFSGVVFIHDPSSAALPACPPPDVSMLSPAHSVLPMAMASRAKLSWCSIPARHWLAVSTESGDGRSTAGEK